MERTRSLALKALLFFSPPNEMADYTGNQGQVAVYLIWQIKNNVNLPGCQWLLSLGRKSYKGERAAECNKLPGA